MRLLLLTNSLSGTSGRRAQAERLVERLRAKGAVVEAHAPGSVEAMKAAAASATRKTHDVVIACGGDGTLSTIVNGLVDVPKKDRPALAILPAGRGNDFAAAVGMKTVEDTLDALAKDERHHIDLGRTDDGVFLGVAGAGFDAQTARRAQGTRWLSGSVLYSYAVVRTLFEFRHVEARVRYDGGSYEGPITFAAVGNNHRYGGGMHITPHAELDDGLLDLCLVKDVSRARLLYMFPTVFSGGHLSDARVSYHQTRFVEIETDEPAELFADGEFLSQTPVRVEVMERELELVTPRTRNPRAR